MKKQFWLTIICFLFFLLEEALGFVGGNLSSTLWIQTAAEYQAVALQTYRTATRQLDQALLAPSWTAALEQTHDYHNLMPAVILDIDETVLDNSGFQAQLQLDGKPHDPVLWDEWVHRSSATAVPGALAFIAYVKSKGVAILYITNRACRRRSDTSGACPQKAETIYNLKRLGFPDLNKHDRLLLRRERAEWSSEKRSRRLMVVQNYRILLLIGDDLGDFLPDVKQHTSSAKRAELTMKHQNRWGVQWFMLPNPMYGSWLRILGDAPTTHLKGYK
jgi:acid phosphatase